MKVILTGCTGFIGREVLEQCLQDQSITSIIALTRRHLPFSFSPTTNNNNPNPKLHVALMEDFLSYPDSLLQDIKGAEACIWSLGKASAPDNDTARRVSVDYTLAAAKAFTPEDSNGGGTFRFVYLSGAAAERDQTKPLWFMQDYRRIRVAFCTLPPHPRGARSLRAEPVPGKMLIGSLQGQAENALLSYAGEHRDGFEAYIMRPGFVLAKETTVKDLVRGMGPSVKVDVLAAAMLAVARKGNETLIVENATLNQLGR